MGFRLILPRLIYCKNREDLDIKATLHIQTRGETEENEKCVRIRQAVALPFSTKTSLDSLDGEIRWIEF
jgi:hypothetical protein